MGQPSSAGALCEVVKTTQAALDKCDRNGAPRSESGVDVVTIAVSTRGAPSLYRVPRECPSSFDLYMWGER